VCLIDYFSFSESFEKEYAMKPNQPTQFQQTESKAMKPIAENAPTDTLCP